MRLLHLGGNLLTELDDRFDALFPALASLIITNNPFNCTYLRKFLLTLKRNYGVFDADVIKHETNIAQFTCTTNGNEQIINNPLKLDGNALKLDENELQ